MWYQGAGAEVAVQCPHCNARDWRTAEELKGGRMFCFFCARISAWPLEGRAVAGRARA